MSSQNILLINSDQHRYDCVGAHGHPMVQTPNLDRLIREGTTFRHAFSTIPICSPARASLLTGTWPSTHRCIGITTCDFYQPALRNLPVLTELLRQAGYQTRWTGKFHGEVEGTPTDHGVDEFIGLFEYRKWREQNDLPTRRRSNSLLGEVDETTAPTDSSLAWQADQIIAQLDRCLEDGRPFLLRWDPPEPHLPCHPTRPFADRYDPASIEPWASWPDPLENKPQVQSRQLDIWGIRDWSWEKFQPIVRSYFGIISELDYHLGRILSAFEERGLLDETLVLYSTDHGDFCGGHGMMDKHFSMYDDIVRVPLIVRQPGLVPAGQACEAFSSNSIDLARTILEAAGIEPPESFVGQDLVALARGDAPNPREDMFAQYFGTESGLYSERMVRDRRYKYVFNPTASDELYDLETDPGEIVNRIDDPELSNELQRLRGRLIAWMEEANDRLLNRWTRVHLEGAPSVAAEADLE